MGARTFFCHSCQCEKSVAIKVRVAKTVVRCRDCVERGKSRPTGSNSLYSREFNRWLDDGSKAFIPYERPVIDQGIREAYAATRAADGD